MSVLQRLGLATGGDPTQGADVLFEKEPALRHPQCRVRYIRYETDKVDDRFFDDRWISGPLGFVFEEVVGRIAARVRIPATFQPNDPHRTDLPTYAMAALREGVVNALAHRDDAAVSSGVIVWVFPGRIEIWTSGSLPSALKMADLKKVHPSIPTNPDLPFVLYRRGFMDCLGRGTQTIVSGCKELGVRPPQWESRPTGVTLTIFSAGGTQQAIELKGPQARLIARLRPGGSVKANEYRAQEDLSDRQARRDLQP